MKELRLPVATVGVIDGYCDRYRNLFGDVRNFECFKQLHVGILSELPRKTLPEIAKLVGLKDGQSLHHFLRDGIGSVMHDLRHTFATERVGLISVEELRALMGHQNIQDSYQDYDLKIRYLCPI
jgi:integrase